MRYTATCIMLAASLTLAMGCENGGKNKTAKEEVTQQWKDARAGVQYAMAKQQYDAGALPQARKSIDAALELSPQHLPALLLSARLHIEQGQLDSAEAMLARAGALDPKNAEVDYLSGVVCQRWQKPEAALALYHSAFTKAPTELAYLLAEAETLVSLERSDEALALLNEKVIYFEHSAAIRDAVGQLLVQKGRYAEAIEMLRRAVVLAPEEMQMREHLALALYYGGQHRDAADALHRLLKHDLFKDRADLHTALGETYLQLNRARDARAAFDRATQLEPASATLWVRLGKAAVQLEDERRAEISLKKALSLDGTLAEAHLMMGYLRLKQDRLADALTSFNQAANLDRTDPVSLCMVGYVLEKLGRPAQAMGYYSQALRLQPDDELATRLMADISD
jgi:tetratricopeptide (TPR) repeat protein